MRRLGAPVPLTGRYASQGRQMAAGLTAWARVTDTRLRVEDDQSQPNRSAEIFASLIAGGIDVVLGPYGSDSVRKVALSLPATVIWNHGAAANDVQQLPNVVSLPSPSSQYLIALARAVAQLRPGGSVACFMAPGRFAQCAWKGLEQAMGTLDLKVLGPLPLALPNLDAFPLREGQPGGVGDLDAMLAVGPVEQELPLFRQLLRRRREMTIGGVSPGLINFPELLGDDAEGILAPVQWHRSLGSEPRLGPSSIEVIDHVRGTGLPPLDYVAAQAYAAALIANHCLECNPSDPRQAAEALRTSTFFGDFQVDPTTGVQIGHRLAVIQWRSGRQQLLT